jgi:hypothetical protein
MDGFLLSFSGSLGQPAETLEDDIDVTKRVGEVERAGERAGIQAGGDLRVGGDKLAKVTLFVPGRQCIPLDESVGLTSREPGLDERQEDALAENEAV